METFRDIKKIKFSVLMSIYKKENPVFFLQAVESVINQTIKPAEIVIVKDGPLPEVLEHVCAEILSKYPSIVRFVSLDKNMGLGLALRSGILACRYNLIARMDTDDIAVPNRFELQLREFVENKNLDICGGYIGEFNDNPDIICSIRKVPQDSEDIYLYAKKRNPFNHMTVMFRRDSVICSGNYEHYPLMEDYYLWFRMILKKCIMKNIDTVLVKARIGNNMVEKRGGIKYFFYEMKLFKEFYDRKFINLGLYVVLLIVRFVSRVVPSPLRKIIYRYFLR